MFPAQTNSNAIVTDKAGPPDYVTFTIPNHPASVHLKQHKAGGRKYYASLEKWKYYIRASLRGRGLPIYDKAPLRATIVFTCKPRTFAGLDIDNPLDFTLDAMKGLVYKDDSHIHLLVARKIRGTENKTSILVAPLMEG